MKILKISVSAFLILASVSASFAGLYAQMRFIGFSRDGKYLAYEETGTESLLMHDMTTYYIDTAKNSIASRYTILEGVEGRDGHPDFRHGEVVYKRSVATKLRKFGIRSGNTGQFVVAHFLNDLSFVKPVEQEGVFFEEGSTAAVKRIVPNYAGGFFKGGTTEVERVLFNDFVDPFAPKDDYALNTDEFFELALIPSVARAADPCSEAYKFELTLKDNTTHHVSNLQILQKDSDTLPEGRNCALGYKIEQVYIYSDRIAVFLNVFSKGFEGPDMHYMVVTGVIAGR